MICLKSSITRNFAKSVAFNKKILIFGFIDVYVQSHIFKSVWLIHKIFLHWLPKVADILKQK